MNWLANHRRSALICGLTLLLPLLLVLYAVAGMWSARAGYQSDIDYLTPRLARLQGLLGQQELLRASHEQALAATGSLLFAAAQDRATVATNLQTRVRKLLSDAGLSVSNSQVLPGREQAGFDYIGVRLSVTGTLDALDAALDALAQERPLLLVQSMDVKPARARRSQPQSQNITATLQLLSLREVQ